MSASKKKKNSNHDNDTTNDDNPTSPINSNSNVDTNQLLLAQMSSQMSALMTAFTSLQSNYSNLQQQVVQLSQEKQNGYTNKSITINPIVIKEEPNMTHLESQGSPGASTDNGMLTNSSSSSVPYAQPPQPKMEGKAPYNIYPAIDGITKGNNNLMELVAGATITHHGAIMLDGKKIKPNTSREVDVRSIATSGNTRIVTLSSKEDKIMVNSILTSIGLDWPHSLALESFNLSIPKFEAGYAHSAPSFISWQAMVIDECKRVGLQDILLKPLDYISNEILKVNFVVGKGSNDEDTMAIKAAIIRSVYDLSKQLFFLLKTAVQEKELFILSSLLAESRIYEANTPTLFVEGNTNLLWRMLDENYHRINASAIEEANRAFDSISYATGKKGGTIRITSAATNNLIVAIYNANRNLSYVDKGRSEAALKSLLLGKLPADLWNIIQAVTINNRSDEMSYNEMCKLVIDHSRTIEERRNTIQTETVPVNQVATGAGVTRPAKGNGTTKCGKCNGTTHATKDHFDCNRCKKSHHPNYCPLDKGKAATHAVTTNGHGKGNGARGTEQVSTTKGKPLYACNVSVERGTDGNVIGVNYTVGDVSFAEHRKCVIDTGGAAHVACSEKYLFNIKEVEHPVYITLPDGSEIRVTHYGSMMLTKDLIIRRVLLVPKFRVNIISVALLTDKNISVKFNSDNCQLRAIEKDGQLGTIIANIKRTTGNIYVLTLPTEPHEPRFPEEKDKKKGSVKELAEKPKDANYSDNRGKIFKKPTTVAVKVVPQAKGNKKPEGTPNTRANAKAAPGGPSHSKANDISSSSSSSSSVLVNATGTSTIVYGTTNSNHSDSDSE